MGYPTRPVSTANLIRVDCNFIDWLRVGITGFGVGSSLYQIDDTVEQISLIKELPEVDEELINQQAKMILEFA